MADNSTTQSGTLATLPAGETYGFDDVDGVKIARSKTGFGADGSYTDVSAAAPLPVVQTGTPPLPTGAATAANQATIAGHLDGVETLLGTIDTDTGAIATATAAAADTLARAATGSVSAIADTATSTTLLSSSASRKGFRITNTSSAVLYVKYGTTASATDFTARLPQYAYLEENFYSGRVDAVWASDPGDGAALITSLSA